MHCGMIWIVSVGNVFIFFMIDDLKVIYFCLYTFSFLGSISILLFNML
jgi:hypothetical protein